jgi:hypothetical protein
MTVEAGSYYLRHQSHDNQRQILPFILSTLLIMGAAPMLAATIYMSLKRIVSQIAGSAMRADVKSQSTGTTLVMAGLVTQVVIFIIYIALTARVHIRLNRNPTKLSDHPALTWRKYMWNLYFISGLFLVRNFIRIIEFKQGDDGWLLSNEAPIYIFDGGFMLTIVVMMAAVHPGRLARKVVKMEKGGAIEMNWRDSAKEPFRPLASQV